MPVDPLVLGADLGGTSTRVLVARLDGTPVGRGTAGGGNPVSRPRGAARELGRALASALAGLDPARVVSAVAGTAGSGLLPDGRPRPLFARVWAEAVPGCAPHHRSDLEVAFASGTPAPHGTVLVAGTGATAGVIRDHGLVRSFDGHGWLLGDDGSGFWLGREALRATLRSLDARQPPGPLGRAVVAALLGDGGSLPPGRDTTGATGATLRDDRFKAAYTTAHDTAYDTARESLIAAAYAQPPVELARLSHAVASASAAGDGEAAELVGRAVELLAATAERADAAGADAAAPLVLAGGVAGTDSPVGRGLRERLAGRRPRTARDGVGGAAWLALHALDPALATEAAHTLLTRPEP